MEIVLASNNAHKVEEFQNAFKEYGVKVYSLKEVGIEVDPEETGTTFKENSFIKADAVSKLTDKIVIADDSGLEIEALNNFPGVYSARFMDGHPYEEKFVAINEMLKDKDNRNARFNCTLCVINLESEPLYFEGFANGKILTKSCGKKGFGYDPIFYYEPCQKTFAELTQEEKNKVSHRGNAIKAMVDYLKEKKYI